MISTHRQCRRFLLLGLCCIATASCLGLSIQPADHLVPPPLPEPQYLKHVKAPTYKTYIPTDYQTLSSTTDASHAAAISNDAGIMTRIARWFGFKGTDQQLVSSSDSNKLAYFYPNPKHSNEKHNDEACNLCNKYPWVPMFPPNIPHNVAQQQYNKDQTWLQTSNQPVQYEHQQIPLRQRAVKFNFPSPNAAAIALQNVHQAQTFFPINLPQLSGVALPPLYKAQNFRPTTQTPPQTNFNHFEENVGAHSEVQSDALATVPKTNPSQTHKIQTNPSFEIVKSHQITDFVSSIEYPLTFVQSPAIDLDNIAVNDKVTEQPVSTLPFIREHFNPSQNKHVPASDIITELGNFGLSHSISSPYQETTIPAQGFESTTTRLQYSNSEIHFDNYDSIGANGDNFPSASNHNITSVQNLLNNDETYHQTTITATPDPLIETDEQFQTERVLTNYNENPHHIQTNLILNNELDRPNIILPQQNRIQSIAQNVNVPRPFTRDPNESQKFRVNSKFSNEPEKLAAPLILTHLSNHKIETSTESWPQYSTTPIVMPFFSVSPTPTSNYSSVDASGQYAGIMPPPPLQQTFNNIKPQMASTIQVMKDHPRPFEHSRAVPFTNQQMMTFDKSKSKQQLLQNAHNGQQQMNIVSEIIQRPAVNSKHTTKYLTKILASNLRELLRREHEAKNATKPFTFDIMKLQKNIDDWTEQEYTSLSHRPSTPTLRGRSKHIPTEYLTTTTTTIAPPRSTVPKFKLLNLDSNELSTSINNLEPLIIDRNIKRYHNANVKDNIISTMEDVLYPKMWKTTTTTTTTTIKPYSTTTVPLATITTTIPTSTTPAYLRDTNFSDAEELWKKAKVDISPKTMEKVYVVTPQPLFYPQRMLPLTQTEPTILEDVKKAPRFLVRPTPGSHIAQLPLQHSSDPFRSLYNTDNFGLKGLTAFVPAKPVEIIDGSSKVATIASTMESFMKTDLTLNHNDTNPMKKKATLKATMQPSPR